MLAGCGGIFSVCGPASFDKGKQQAEEAGKEQWSYIGQNAGSYEKVFTYRFVGQGQGDFDFEQQQLQQRGMAMASMVPAGVGGSAAPPTTVQERFTVLKWLLLCLGSTGLITVALASTLLALSSTGEDPVAASTSSSPPLPMKATAAGMSLSFDCERQDWKEWSPIKRTYCCEKKKLHCSGPAPDQPAFAGGQSSEERADRTIAAELSKRRSSEAARPSSLASELADEDDAVSGSVEESCLAACSLGGFRSTCGALLRRVAAKAQLTGGTTGVCTRAQAQVLAKCPACKTCTPEAAGCSEVAGLKGNSSEAGPAEGPPVARAPGARDSVPVEQQRAPERGSANASLANVPAKAAEEPSHGPADAGQDVGAGGYDCRRGLESWQQTWSLAKRSWCCQRGRCPAPVNYDCEAGGDRREHWSLFKKSWCCAHRLVGCPEHESLTFDCNEGFKTWKATWSRTKQAWCCAHEQKACPEREVQARVVPLLQ